jgi:hypothetical protein
MPLATDPRENAESSYRLLFILGAGHSGSTLLNLLLNAHSEAVGLCEVHTMQRYLTLPPDDSRNPLRHRFWQNVARRWHEKTGLPFSEIDLRTPTRRELRRWQGKDLTRYRQHNLALFESVALVSGARVIVDSSHSRWRLIALDRSGVSDLRVIHMIRDGRALVNSYSRKYNSLRVGLRRWFVPTVMSLLLQPRIRAPWMTVRYEDLAENPEQCLDAICQFAGLLYQPTMIRYWEHEDVSVGGNRMRGGKKPVRLDEKWRNQLTFRSRVVFALMGSWLNIICGYNPIARRLRKSALTEPDDAANQGMHA